MKDTNHRKSMLFVYRAEKTESSSLIETNLEELWNLVTTLGNIDVMDLFVQRAPIHPSTFIGSGKVQEILSYIAAGPVDIILFGGTLSPRQKFTLSKLFWQLHPSIRIWDRIDLILAIFAKHAHTSEAKLQIELARMHHMGPAIFGMGKILSRQGGGIGTRGIGETNTELMKRHWKREIKRITDILTTFEIIRKKQISQRKAGGKVTFSLVGYTNAGKTSLFNVLTRKKKLVRNALFATLDSTAGEAYIPSYNASVLVTDTIGFIQNLPPDLLDAFTSTLLESVHADAVLHVIDASDARMEEKIRVVEQILTYLNIPEEKVIYVYNKIDKIPRHLSRTLVKQAYPYPAVCVSSKTGEKVSEILPTALKISHVIKRKNVPG